MHTASEVAKWFLAYNRMNEIDAGAEAISNLKLQKMLYYAQGCFLGITGRPLFSDTIVAWQHGPVVESVYHEYKRFGSNGIEFNDDFDASGFSDEEVSILRQVYELFGQYSAWKLRDMTHQEYPWQMTEPNKEIELGLIRDYFKSHYVE